MKKVKVPNSIHIFWEGLTPNQQRVTAIVGIISLVFIFVAILSGSEDDVVRKNKES